MMGTGRLRLRCSLGYSVVAQQEKRTDEVQGMRASKTALLLMAMIVICLAMLAVFANVQRSQREALEAVTIRSTTSPTPQER